MRLLVLAMALIALPASVNAAEKEWAEGIPFHTDWGSAIKEVKETGKMLFIYNGWQGKGI